MLLIVFLTLCLVPVHIIQKTLQTLWYTFLTFHYNFPRLIRCDHEFGPPNCLATDYFTGDFWGDCRVWLIFLKCCPENLSFPKPAGWIKTKAYNSKFPYLGKYISCSYWKQIYCLKLLFLRSNRHLFVQILLALSM